MNDRELYKCDTCGAKTAVDGDIRPHTVPCLNCELMAETGVFERWYPGRALGTAIRPCHAGTQQPRSVH